jgi:sodium/hydrogen exchanger-like protein 6/7
MPTAATAPPTGATDPIRLFLWSLGNGTNERALCETLADFFKPLCPLADLVDREICVDYKVAYTARCGSGAFRFAGEGTFLYLTLSLLWVLSVALLLRFWRISYIPDSAVTIAVGWVTGALLSLTPDGGSRRRFDEQVFFDVLLPVIIFEAGYNMNRRAMRKQLAQVAALAVLGTCVSFLVTTGLMLGFASLAGRHLPLLDAATFGALISSTDPVAVVAVFAQFGVPAPLYTLIFGESTLNDAVAVALYGSLKWVYQHPTLARGVRCSSAAQRAHALGADARTQHTHTHQDKVQHLLQSFFAVSFGSTAVGLACGCAVGLAWKRLPIFVHPVLETLVYIISALLPYYLAEEAGWSGVIAILFAAVAMATYAHPNLSKQAGYHVTFIVECLSRLFEAAIFGYLGTQMVINSEKVWMLHPGRRCCAPNPLPGSWCGARWRWPRCSPCWWRGLATCFPSCS